MVKRTGNAKLIDIGSAYEWARGAAARSCSLAYAAPEVLDGEGGCPRSDLASLGYVLVELLAGTPPSPERPRATITARPRPRSWSASLGRSRTRSCVTSY